MNGSNGRHSSLYEQTLDYARREIDDASAQITKLRERLSYLEARMEAAKAVYEAVAARLNVEDEIGEPEEAETRHQAEPSSVVSREEISRLLHAQEPPPREIAPPPPAAAPSREPVGLSTAEMDLIRRHLEAQRPAAPSLPPPEPAPAVAAAPARRGASGGLSDEDRRLIEEHLRRRIETERQNA